MSSSSRHRRTGRRRQAAAVDDIVSCPSAIDTRRAPQPFSPEAILKTVLDDEDDNTVTTEYTQFSKFSQQVYSGVRHRTGVGHIIAGFALFVLLTVSHHQWNTEQEASQAAAVMKELEEAKQHQRESARDMASITSAWEQRELSTTPMKEIAMGLRGSASGTRGALENKPRAVLPRKPSGADKVASNPQVNTMQTRSVVKNTVKEDPSTSALLQGVPPVNSEKPVSAAPAAVIVEGPEVSVVATTPATPTVEKAVVSDEKIPEKLPQTHPKHQELDSVVPESHGSEQKSPATITSETLTVAVPLSKPKSSLDPKEHEQAPKEAIKEVEPEKSKATVSATVAVKEAVSQQQNQASLAHHSPAKHIPSVEEKVETLREPAVVSEVKEDVSPTEPKEKEQSKEGAVAVSITPPSESSKEMINKPLDSTRAIVPAREQSASTPKEVQLEDASTTVTKAPETLITEPAPTDENEPKLVAHVGIVAATPAVVSAAPETKDKAPVPTSVPSPKNEETPVSSEGKPAVQPEKQPQPPPTEQAPAKVQEPISSEQTHSVSGPEPPASLVSVTNESKQNDPCTTTFNTISADGARMVAVLSLPGCKGEQAAEKSPTLLA